MNFEIETTNLIEITQTDLTVDREAGVIRNVKILGQVSANGRRYPDKTMRAATGLYEGLGVFVNHPPRTQPDQERKVEDRFGWLERVHVKQNEGVFGDLHVLKSHDMANPIFETAERNPRLIGLSHNAAGKEKRQGSTTIVEEIQRVRSVDIVTTPATTRGLFESEDSQSKEEDDMKKTVKEVLKTLDHKDPLVKFLEQAIGDEGMLPAAAEAPVEDGADAMKAAFRAAIIAAFDDESLDTKATMKKIGEVLKAYDKLTSSDKTDDSSADDSSQDDSDTQESVDPKLAEKVKKLERRDKARSLLEDAGISAKDSKHREAMIESLSSVSDETAKTLIETWKAEATEDKQTKPPQRPRSGSLLRESRDESSDPKKFAREFLQ